MIPNQVLRSCFETDHRTTVLFYRGLLVLLAPLVPLVPQVFLGRQWHWDPVAQ